MKEALAFVGIIALATVLWFARGYSDSEVIASQEAQIHSLQDAVHAKDEVIAKQKELTEDGALTIKALQDSLRAKDDLMAKDQSLLQEKDDSISSLKDTIQAKDEIIRRDNVPFTGHGFDPPFFFPHPTIPPPPLTSPNKTVDSNQYVKDSGFEAEDLGSGFSAYQVMGPVHQPPPNDLPAKIPNRTPWVFGEGNSGIAANGSGYGVSGASNHDSNGVTSTNGQAGIIEYEGSSISQTVELPAGTFSVSFDFEGRRDYMPANRVAVFIGDKLLYSGAPTSTDHFVNVTTKSATFLKPGKHELKFIGMGNDDTNAPYPATFIDNVCIVPSDEHSPDPTASDSGSQRKLEVKESSTNLKAL